MSGGSYNYLCCKDASEISERKEDIGKMRDMLNELGFIDAAIETESVLLTISAYEVKMNARLQRLSDLWRSVEWYDSGDSSLETAQEEYEKYANK